MSAGHPARTTGEARTWPLRCSLAPTCGSLGDGTGRVCGLHVPRGAVGPSRRTMQEGTVACTPEGTTWTTTVGCDRLSGCQAGRRQRRRRRDRLPVPSHSEERAPGDGLHPPRSTRGPDTFTRWPAIDRATGVAVAGSGRRFHRLQTSRSPSAAAPVASDKLSGGTSAISMPAPRSERTPDPLCRHSDAANSTARPITGKVQRPIGPVWFVMWDCYRAALAPRGDPLCSWRRAF
jgi:hypothetical protein